MAQATLYLREAERLEAERLALTAQLTRAAMNAKGEDFARLVRELVKGA